MPTFAFAAAEEGGARVAVRGDVVARATIPTGERQVSGSGASTWHEESFASATALRLEASEERSDPPSSPGSDGRGWPVVGGIVQVAWIDIDMTETNEAASFISTSVPPQLDGRRESAPDDSLEDRPVSSVFLFDDPFADPATGDDSPSDKPQGRGMADGREARDNPLREVDDPQATIYGDGQEIVAEDEAPAQVTEAEPLPDSSAVPDAQAVEQGESDVLEGYEGSDVSSMPSPVGHGPSAPSDEAGSPDSADFTSLTTFDHLWEDRTTVSVAAAAAVHISDEEDEDSGDHQAISAPGAGPRGDDAFEDDDHDGMTLLVPPDAGWDNDHDGLTVFGLPEAGIPPAPDGTMAPGTNGAAQGGIPPMGSSGTPPFPTAGSMISSVPWGNTPAGSASSPPASYAPASGPAQGGWAPSDSSTPTNNIFSQNAASPDDEADHTHLAFPHQLPPGAPSTDPAVAPATPTVLARVCAQCGTPNSTRRSACSSCGAPLTGEATPVPRPILGVIEVTVTSLGTTERYPLDRPVVLGRKPRSTRFSVNDVPRLIAVNGPRQDISRSHLRIDLEDWSVIASDLGSTNGTVLRRPGQPDRRLQAPEQVVAQAGDVYDLGDGVTVAIVELA
ncbi:MAG: FHA domain-containing protein [Propionibacteriaceae bacterium]|nr:FHA domain-containing protein [Propionibacteriaceae bacterium]